MNLLNLFPTGYRNILLGAGFALLVLAGLDVAKQEARQAAHRAKATPSQTAEEAI